MGLHGRIGQPLQSETPIEIVSYCLLVIPLWEWQLNEFSTQPNNGSRERVQSNVLMHSG